MTAPQSLCKMEMIEADFGLVEHAHHAPEHGFAIRIKSDGHETRFNIAEAHAQAFVDQLEVLAALMRSRILEAREAGET